MNESPANLIDLLLRIFPPAAEGSRVCGPFLASVVALNDEDQPEEAVSTVVESVTSSEACLLHSQPLAGSRLEVRVAVSTGEVLRMTVQVASTANRGPLVQTIARFLHPRAEPS